MYIKDGVKVTEQGFAGHYCCADYCLFRRNTLLEYKNKKWVVSTVGRMKEPKLNIDTFSGLGGLFGTKNGYTPIGYSRFYETMAFKAMKEQEEPNGEFYWIADVTKQIFFDSEWALEECDFGSDHKANDMHEKVVDELIMKIKEK